MKIIFDNESKDSINLKDIDPNKHIVVYISSDKEPGIVTKDNYYSKNDTYMVRYLGSALTNGNTFSFSSKTFPEIIKEKPYAKWGVFVNKDWKKALQWLIDNGK